MADQTGKVEYERLNSHFQACLELTRSDRERYISKLSSSDPGLEKELRELLRFHEQGAQASSVTPAPAVSAAPEETRARRKKSWVSAPVVILLFGGLALGAVLAVQVWALARLEGDLKQQMASNLKSAVDLRVSNLRSWAAAQKQHAQKILQDPVLAEHVSSLMESVKGVEGRDALRARLSAHPSGAVVVERMMRAPAEITDRGFSVLSSSGLCLSTDYEPLVGVTLSTAGADYLGRLNLGETLMSRPYPDRLFAQGVPPDPRKPVMFVAGPIRDASGRVIAVGSFRFTPTRLYEILSSANAEFVAFDAKSLVLNNLKDGADLQSRGLADVPDTAFQMHLRDPGAELARGKRPETPPESWPPTLMSRSAIQGHPGMDAVGHRDLRGRMVVAAWTWLPEWEMGIGGQVPVDAVVASAAPVRMAFTTLIVVFAVLTLGLFAATRFLRIRRRSGPESPFGAYIVERPIGKGGMAEVFLARHAFLKRPAALKILSQPNPLRASVERFEREARLASTLAHPNTIQVFDFGETPDGRLYYAMEFVQGLTLAQLLALGGPPPVGRAIHLLRQIAGSLAEAHQAGLLHRDLKPSNIMLTSRGGIADVVKVLDFGIACSLTPGTEDYTRSTSLLGTPAFVAPERIRAPQALDPRSDLYSFGAVAFHLLTGRYLFEGSNPSELLYQVITAPRPSPSQLRGSEVPEDLERLVLSCVSIDPDARPSSIREIESLLEAAGRAAPWTQEQAVEWWTANQERVASFIAATP